MPTTVSRNELDELRELINAHIEETGESVTAMAERAGVKRWLLTNLRSGKYASSPTLENYQRVLKAIGKRTIIVDA